MAGSVVTGSLGGNTIIREVVTPKNPQTQKQVDQRASFKLMTQLAAVMSQVIAIPSEGNKTGRNRFIAANFPLVTSNSGVAMATLENVQLTSSQVGLPQIVASRSNGVLKIELAKAAYGVGRIVYAIFSKTDEHRLQLVDAPICSVAGSNSTFPYQTVDIEGNILILAYGILDKTSAASASFGNMMAYSGQDVAQLVYKRQFSQSDYGFTVTRGTSLLAGQEEIEKVEDGKARVFVTASGDGTVTGAGTYDLGSEVTVTAIANEGSTFKGWKNNGSSEIISTSPSFSFTLNGQADLIAIFEKDQVEDTTYSVQIVAYKNGVKTVIGEDFDGAGAYSAGQTATIVAPATLDGLDFVAWKSGSSYNGPLVSNERSYSFKVTGNATFSAMYSGDADE